MQCCTAGITPDMLNTSIFKRTNDDITARQKFHCANPQIINTTTLIQPTREINHNRCDITGMLMQLRSR